MFTGIVQYIGLVKSVQRTGFGARLWLDIGSVADGLAAGASVAINGACLTASELQSDRSGFDVVAETLERTALGTLSAGDAVNVEAALKLTDALDGHIVQGHVDTVATLKNIDSAAGQWNMSFSCERRFTDEMVEKGSVAIDGVSLTLTAVTDGNFSVSIIPTTLAETTLGKKSAGDKVNIETDILGKYVRRLLGVYAGNSSQSGQNQSTLTLGKLMDAGFMD